MTPSGELSFTYKLARSLCLAGAVAAGVQPVDGVFADFKDEDGLERRSRGRAPRRLHRQARHPPGAGRDHQRRLHAVGGRHSRTPRRSSPRSRHSPTPACCRSAAKWSTARTSCRPGAYWNDHDRRFQWPRLQNRNPRTPRRPRTGRPPPRAGAPTPPTSRCGRWSSSAARFGPTTSRSRSPTPASATATCTPAATTGAARAIR